MEIILAFVSTGMTFLVSELKTFDAWLGIILKLIGCASGALTVWLLVMRIRDFGSGPSGRTPKDDRR